MQAKYSQSTFISIFIFYIISFDYWASTLFGLLSFCLVFERKGATLQPGSPGTHYHNSTNHKIAIFKPLPLMFWDYKHELLQQALEYLLCWIEYTRVLHELLIPCQLNVIPVVLVSRVLTNICNSECLQIFLYREFGNKTSLNYYLLNTYWKHQIFKICKLKSKI